MKKIELHLLKDEQWVTGESNFALYLYYDYVYNKANKKVDLNWDLKYYCYDLYKTPIKFKLNSEEYDYTTKKISDSNAKQKHYGSMASGTITGYAAGAIPELSILSAEFTLIYNGVTYTGFATFDEENGAGSAVQLDKIPTYTTQLPAPQLGATSVVLTKSQPIQLSWNTIKDAVGYSLYIKSDSEEI